MFFGNWKFSFFLSLASNCFPRFRGLFPSWGRSPHRFATSEAILMAPKIEREKSPEGPPSPGLYSICMISNR